MSCWLVCIRGLISGAVDNMSLNGPAHRFIDPLYKHSQEKDGGDGWSEVARDRLDVVKQLTALSCLDHWYPTDTDGYNAQNPDSEDEHEKIFRVRL